MKLRCAAALCVAVILSVGISFGGEAPGRRGLARVGLDIPPGPAAFGIDSAELTHTYFPLTPGGSLAWSGFGAWSGDLRLMTGMAVELVDGVQCLRVRDEDLSSGLVWSADDGQWVRSSFWTMLEYWLAQDTAGNIWLLRWREIDTDDGSVLWDEEFGVGSAPLELWSDLIPGDTWTADDGAQGQVVSVTAGVGPLRTGGGAYSGCLHIRWVYPNGLSVDRYYAPGVGLVREVFTEEGERFGYDKVPSRHSDPGFGAIEFGADRFYGLEETGSFPVTIVRSGGNDGVVAVEFEVAAATLTFIAPPEDFDYFSDWKIVFLAPGQQQLTFDVALHDNSLWNNRTTLEIQLNNTTWGAELGSRTTAEVFVDEAESGTDPGTFIGPCFLDTLQLR